MSIRAFRPAFLAAFLFCTGFLVMAQTSETETPSVEAPAGSDPLPIDSEWNGPAPKLYSKGDKTFIINLGTVLPLFFYSADGNSLANNLSVGGTGSLNYNYYFNSNLALGGEFGGSFSGTLGGNMLFMMPFGVKGTWHFIASPFEFPVSLMVGGVTQSYLGTDYFGLIVKPGVAAYWRFNPDWSFGLNSAWWWIPEWTSSASTSSYGNFLELTLSARYHF